MTRALPVIGLLLSCTPQPLDLPTEASIAEFDREAQPALYQLLYDAPSLPSAQPIQMRLRMLIWLRHMDLSSSQLGQLEVLRALVEERRARIVAAEETTAARWAEQEGPIIDALWEHVASGGALDAPEVRPLVDELAELKAGGEREAALLKLRVEGIRSILEAEGDFLHSLSPEQEAMLTDALFVLRSRLDPVGNPGDYRALVGTTYEPGQYAVLTRGLGEGASEPLNIGALWSDDPALTGHALHEARREVLLYLLLLEPELDAAITTAQSLQ